MSNVSIFEADVKGKHKGVHGLYKLSKELKLNFIIKGSGKEYENVREIKDFKNLLIIPINYPKAYDVSNPHLNKRLSINQLRYYNQAPANLSILEKNNINFSISWHIPDFEQLKDLHLIQLVELEE